MDILGRKKETTALKELIRSKKPEFLAIYGRRRIGKTYLVKNYFNSEDCEFISMTGIEGGTFSEQRKASIRQISNLLLKGLPLEVPKTWFDIFEILTNAINDIPKTRNIVIFLDEFPWMVTPRSRLLQALEYFWNQHWSNDSRIKLIVCGSSASWIIKNIINNTGGLYGRVTCRMKLEPLSLAKSKQFLHQKGIKLSNDQILSLYLVTGGIPLYLDQVKRGMSANQTIDEICFQKNGLLVDELPEIFKSLYLKESVYIDIVKIIANHQYGIGQANIAKLLDYPQSGRLTKRLKELEDSGFILSFIPFHHKEKGLYYRVIDEYTIFYFRWIEPNLRSINKLSRPKDYWMELAQNSEYKSWKGYAFESICYKHIEQIMKSLSLKPTDIPYSWRYASRKGSEDSGAQIDLLFDRRDGTITICEMKYTDNPFVIDKTYAKNLQNKVSVFQKQTRTSKHMFIVMISVNGIKKTMYSEELIDNVVTLKDLFIDI